jgi:hypothetical protein
MEVDEVNGTVMVAIGPPLGHDAMIVCVVEARNCVYSAGLRCDDLMFVCEGRQASPGLCFCLAFEAEGISSGEFECPHATLS